MNLNSFNYKTFIPVRFGDLNAFGIVNNDVYLTYFEIAHTGYWKQILNWKSATKGILTGKVEVEYLRPIRIDNEINAYVRTARVGNCSFDTEFILTISNASGEEICTKGVTTNIYFDYEQNKAVPIPEEYKEKMTAFEALVH